MNKNQPIRIGYVGAGSNTRKMHLPGFSTLEGVVNEVVANRSEASSRKVANQFGIARIAKDWRAVVEDPKVDAICIGTWPYLHHDISIAALQNGKHVLCEARIAMNLAEARDMITVAKKYSDLVFQIVPAPFTLEFDSIVQNLLEKNALGSLNEVHAHHATAANLDPHAPLTWRQSRKYSGDNILSMGIFHETIYRWLRENPVSVQAHAYTATPTRLNPETDLKETVGIPDALAVSGMFPSGARLAYEFSSLESGPPRMEIRLNGSKGCLQFDGIAGLLTFWQSPESEPVAYQPISGKGWKVEYDFIHSIREGSPVRLTSAKDAIAYMEFTQAVQDALAVSCRL